MKVRVLGILFSVLSLTLVGCGQKTPPPEEPQPVQPAAAPAAALAAAPADAGAVCAGMVEAAKAKDMDKIFSVSTPGAAEALAPAGLKDGVMGALAGGPCGEVKVAADDANRATVQLKGGKELPFVKNADGWRFDVATYVAKNAAPAAADKGAKGAKRGGAKKKGKKGK